MNTRRSNAIRVDEENVNEVIPPQDPQVLQDLIILASMKNIKFR